MPVPSFTWTLSRWSLLKHHADDVSDVDPETGSGSVGGGAAEGKLPALGRHQPVATPIRGGGHPLMGVAWTPSAGTEPL